MWRNRAGLHLTAPVSERDHVLGATDAPITLLEYGDYECPFCSRSFPVVQDLRRQFGPGLRFVFRHFPQIQHHPHALQAAEAAEAAAAQGRFWEMHEQLFNHQRALELRDLQSYASAIGLERAAFDRALTERQYRARVEEDRASGAQSGVDRTPTFFINNTRHDGAADFESLLHALRRIRPTGR